MHTTFLPTPPRLPAHCAVSGPRNAPAGGTSARSSSSRSAFARNLRCSDACGAVRSSGAAAAVLWARQLMYQCSLRALAAALRARGPVTTPPPSKGRQVALCRDHMQS